MLLCLWGLDGRRPAQRELEEYSPARGKVAHKSEKQYEFMSHRRDCLRVQQGPVTYSAVTDSSSAPSLLPVADGVASMSSVQTTISATISERASEDEGLAGVESSTFGFGVEDGRLFRPEVAPSPDQLSLRFLALADLPIVWGGTFFKRGADGRVLQDGISNPGEEPPQVERK